VLNRSASTKVVLLSAGVGVTPVLAMLQELLLHDNDNRRSIAWIHSARDKDHIAFASEVDQLIDDARSKGRNVWKHVVYTRPSVTSIDDGATSNRDESLGRLDVNLIRSLITDNNWHFDDSVEYYMCGPGSFLADIEDGLVEQMGISKSQVYYETF